MNIIIFVYKWSPLVAPKMSPSRDSDQAEEIKGVFWSFNSNWCKK